MDRYGKRQTVYIWQREEWPRFSWDLERLITPLAEVRSLQGKLQGAMAMLGFESRGNAAIDAMTSDLVSSSAIEGIALNADSVRSSVARKLGLDNEVLVATDHYVEGLVEVMTDAAINSCAPLTAERLFGWHAALFPLGRSGMRRITVGGWRIGDEPMRVVSGAMGREKVHYEAPPSDRVADEMALFFDWSTSAKCDPVLCAAVAHLWLVSIHPFDDGNGRISRTVADYFLSRADGMGQRYYSMSAEILREKREYYEILERTQKGGLDITEWVLWFLGCLRNALLRSYGTVERTLQKAEYWEAHREAEVNERQRKIINRLWDGFDGKLTTSKWAKICHCSTDTALRDINDLIGKGMLRESTERGRSTNYLLR